MKTYKWTEQQKKALRASIKHWERVANGNEEATANNCPCCKLWNKDLDGDCPGCPIAEFTGKSGCHGTPYWSYSYFSEIEENNEEKLDAAGGELNFLRAVYLAGGGK